MWRALFAVSAACTFDHGVPNQTPVIDASCTTSPPWWNGAFTSRFPLSVSAPAGYTLRVDASRALAAGPDVRVIVHDAQTRELDRIVESPSLTFKVPPSGSVWLYAGPSASTAPANPKNVFLFAEDFEGIAAGTNADGPFIPEPPNEWRVVDDAGNHVYRAAGIARHPNAIRDLMPANVEITARMRFNAGGGQNHNGLAARSNSMLTDTMDGFVVQLQRDIGHWRIGEYVDGASPPLEVSGIDRSVTPLVWYSLRMMVINNDISFYVDGEAIAAASKTGSDGTAIGLFAHNCDVDYDDVRVRMATSPEPTATLGAEQRCE